MHRPNNSERFAFERMARTNNRDSLRKVLMIGSVSYVPCSKTVFYVGQGSQPGRTTRVLSRPVALGENPANHVFVDLDLKRQGHLLSDSRTAPVGITLLHFDDRTDELCTRSFRAGLPTAIRGEQHAVLLLAQGFVKAKQCRRLQNDCGTEQTSGTYQECH